MSSLEQGCKLYVESVSRQPFQALCLWCTVMGLMPLEAELLSPSCQSPAQRSTSGCTSEIPGENTLTQPQAGDGFLRNRHLPECSSDALRGHQSGPRPVGSCGRPL